jgi:hypothetical protein
MAQQQMAAGIKNRQVYLVRKCSNTQDVPKIFGQASGVSSTHKNKEKRSYQYTSAKA